MFFGAKHYFKVLYFITAMSPAYLIYSLQLYANEQLEFIRINVYGVPVLVLFLFFLLIFLAYLLKLILIKITNENENPYNIKDIKLKILDKNGSSIVFLIGVIIPSIIFVEESIVINIIIFLLIQLLLYKLMINSTALFPNVLLISFGVHSFKLSDNKYLLSNQRFNSNLEIKASIVGDNSNTLCYVKRGHIS